MSKGIRVAVNGYGVIGKRVADAVAKQEDMRLVGVADVVADWRPRVAVDRGMPLFSATPEASEAMRKRGLKVAGALEDLLGQIDVVVDCTPKRIAAKSGMPRSTATRGRQSAPTSATPTSRMSSCFTTASATRLPMTP